MLAVLFIASIVIFVALRVAPGSPDFTRLHPLTREEARETFREQLGLYDPLPVQYARFLRDLATGDLGVSIQSGNSVAELLKEFGGNTAKLVAAALVLTYVLAIPLGVVAAVNRDTWVDRGIMGFANLAMGIPNFVLALLLISVFAERLGWLPTSGTAGFRAIILPASVLAAEGTAVTLRLTRASLLEQLQQDYMRTLRAGGLSSRYVVWKHGLRNALMPVVSLLGLQIGVLVGYTAIVEIVFRWPGLSQLLVRSVLVQDYPVVLALTLVLTATVILANLAANILYALIDPRVRATIGK